MANRSKAEDIRIAAQRLFLRYGLRQTSMDAIAAEANVSKQTLYRNYHSKDQLFAEVLGSMTYDRLRADLIELLPTGPLSRSELETTLANISRRVVDFLLAPSYLALVRVVISEVRDFPELARLFRSSVMERGAGALAGVLTSPDVEAVVTVDEIGPTLRLLVGPLLSYVLEALLGDAAAVRKRAHEEIPSLVALFVGAISTERPQRSLPLPTDATGS